jgi:SAM-dependent methyltransferase
MKSHGPVVAQWRRSALQRVASGGTAMREQATTITTPATAAALTQAELWGERAGDWAALVESEADPWLGPVYAEVLDRLAVRPGTALLDAGCGAGRFARRAAGRGAHVAGIDITPALLDIARAHVPGADLRLGDLQRLPWPDDAFDVVTGFNTFFYAEDLGEALREAHRVARPGGRLALTAFGRPEHGDFTPVMELIGAALPAFAVEEEAAPPLERFVADAGFTVELADYRRVTERYADMDELVRGYLAIGPLRPAVHALGEGEVAAFMRTAFAPLVRADGSVHVSDEYRLLIARG